MKNRWKNVTLALIMTSIATLFFGWSFEQNPELCALVFLISFPWKYDEITYGLWGGASAGTVVSLFGFYTKSDTEDTYQLFGIAFYDHAARDSYKCCTLSVYQYAGRDAVLAFGLGIRQHAKRYAEAYGSFLIRQRGGQAPLRIYSVVMYANGRLKVW